MEMHDGRICDNEMSSDPVASVQSTCLVSALNIPERRGKRKSTMETLSLLAAGPQPVLAGECGARKPCERLSMHAACVKIFPIDIIAKKRGISSIGERAEEDAIFSTVIAQREGSSSSVIVAPPPVTPTWCAYRRGMYSVSHPPSACTTLSGV